MSAAKGAGALKITSVREEEPPIHVKAAEAIRSPAYNRAFFHSRFCYILGYVIRRWLPLIASWQEEDAQTRSCCR
jgi:hypothetical protein